MASHTSPLPPLKATDGFRLPPPPPVPKGRPKRKPRGARRSARDEELLHLSASADQLRKVIEDLTLVPLLDEDDIAVDIDPVEAAAIEKATAVQLKFAKVMGKPTAQLEAADPKPAAVKRAAGAVAKALRKFAECETVPGFAAVCQALSHHLIVAVNTGRPHCVAVCLCVSRD
jgi:hypothetical protein